MLSFASGLLLAALSPVPAGNAAVPSSFAPRADEVADLVAELGRARDSADPEEVARLAAFGTREAALGLVELYGRMDTAFMRREVLRALGAFDGVPEAEQPALQKLMDVATTARARELRLLAVRTLGGGPGLGHRFLERIVDSPAEDEVRIEALRLHVAHAGEDDRGWYEELFAGEEREKDEPNRTRVRLAREAAPEERELEVHSLPELRELAFGALAGEMTIRELLDATEDAEPDVRRLALVELRERDPKRALNRAEDVFERADEHVGNRVVAAEILAQARGVRIAPEFIDVGCKLATPEELRVALADLLAGFDDDGVNRKLVKRVGKAKGAHERTFVLRAVAGAEDDKLTARIVKELAADEAEVRIAAIAALAERGDAEAVPALADIVSEADEIEVTVAALEALSRLRAGDPEWRRELVAYTDSEDAGVRNAALMSLGSEPENLAVFTRALEHERWTTRRIALEGLEALGAAGMKEVVPLLIARLAEEDGRLQQELADALFRLTGMPFPPDARNWAAWWERAGATFEIPGPEERERLRAAADERALRTTTKAEFLGVQVLSHRVIFVVDTSGSMDFPLRSRFVGDSAGEPRMDVARRELKAAIDSLDAATLFNIITFGAGVDRWLADGVATSDSQSREDAKAWIDRLGALGGTNLHGALAAAFADPDVDTIFILSDGEPSVGEVTDPYAIRALVQRWNRHRNVVIHTLAIGTSLDVLAWLAEDSGGSYQEFR